MYTPEYERYNNPLENSQTVPPSEMDTSMVMPSSLHEDFTFSYNGSPGSMKSSEMMRIMNRCHTVMGECVYYIHICSDNETSMRKYLTHPETRPTGKNILVNIYLKRLLYLSGFLIQPIVPSVLQVYYFS